MKALSLWQPWATLISLGVKSIETRSWSTRYRGPLAIHAAATTKGFDSLPGDCEGTVEAGWRYGYIGEFQAAYCFRTSDEGKRGETYLHRLEGPNATSEPGPCPLGVVVATCTLVDVVPMLSMSDHSPLAGRRPGGHGWIRIGERELGLNRGSGGGMEFITDQRPYGDFTPGRFAWLLDDIEPVDPPVPARGRQQLWEWTA